MAKSTYLSTAMLNFKYRAGAFTVPADLYLALVVADAGFWTASTAITASQWVSPTTANGRFYFCSTAGTTGSTQPTWPTVANGTVTDGTVVWTEGTSHAIGGTLPEVSATGYARVTVTLGSTYFTVPALASDSTGQSIDNTGNLSFGSGSTAAAWGLITGLELFDASTAGNLWLYQALTSPVNISSGAPFPAFSVGNLIIEDL